MTAPTHHPDPGPANTADDHTGEEHGRHSMWGMVLCCIPMVIAVALIAFGR